MEIVRVEGGRFAPGRSANPGGKANGDRERAKVHTDAALETLVEIMLDKSAPSGARARCAIALLERAHGKPTITVDGDVGLGELIRTLADSVKEVA